MDYTSEELTQITAALYYLRQDACARRATHLLSISQGPKQSGSAKPNRWSRLARNRTR